MSGLPGFVAHLPWFLYDLTNRQLITSPVVPDDIHDTKPIVLAEIRIPGLNFEPIYPGGNRNRRIAFQLQVVQRNNVFGNIQQLRMFDMLRNNAMDVASIGGDSQFQPNPKVLYSWGTGSVPLEWFVSRCDWVNTSGWVNGMGNPQHSVVDIELVLDEKSPLYRMEEMARRALAITGQITGIAGVVADAFGGRPPF